MEKGRGGDQGQRRSEERQEARRLPAPWPADEQRGMGLPDRRAADPALRPSREGV
jgi:hypothetical protein